MVGCANKWDVPDPPDILGTNAMAGVQQFIVTNGWNMCTNDDDLANWDKLTPEYIHDLPWTKFKGHQFPAITCGGILYVLTAPGWHGDYGGVAYNPMTNHFPASVEGFRTVGGHWYVWSSLEFPPSGLPKKYE